MLNSRKKIQQNRNSPFSTIKLHTFRCWMGKKILLTLWHLYEE
jgi:hypothetical protein